MRAYLDRKEYQRVGSAVDERILALQDTDWGGGRLGGRRGNGGGYTKRRGCGGHRGHDNVAASQTKGGEEEGSGRQRSGM